MKLELWSEKQLKRPVFTLEELQTSRAKSDICRRVARRNTISKEAPHQRGESKSVKLENLVLVCKTLFVIKN